MMKMNQPSVIAIVGPTASGKTALAIELAKILNTEIISADSRQFYKELPIGSAMPSSEELKSVKHHFISCRSVTDEYSSGSFARDARIIINEVLKSKKQVIVCGGSGLYINTLLMGMDSFPIVTDDARKRTNDLYEAQGLKGWQNMLEQSDPDYYTEVDLKNPARIRRALEVYFSSGKPFSSFRSNSPKYYYPTPVFGIQMPKENLHQRIEERVDKMINQGLEKEAENVYPLRYQKALQTVGYKEFFDYFEGKLTLDECVDLIKTHTRQYAKRQLTWFKGKIDTKWVSSENAGKEIIQAINKY